MSNLFTTNVVRPYQIALNPTRLLVLLALQLFDLAKNPPNLTIRTHGGGEDTDQCLGRGFSKIEKLGCLLDNMWYLASRVSH